MQTELFKTLSVRENERARYALIGGKTRRITVVFDAYWRFAAERQAVYFRRLNGIFPATADPVLGRFKFTNAYRILDRTTQYLVRNVIKEGEQSPPELFFRILLFKLFNKIETWEFLVTHFGELRFADYNFERYDRVLTAALQDGRRVYSAAYIMPSGGPNGESKKHRSHLKLLEKMMRDNVPQKLGDLTSMRDGFELLRSYPMIGNFLAYQFITDLNYSELTNFSEMEFVVPGPGALDGLKKCFPDMTPSEAAPLIRAVCENQSEFQHQLGLHPIDLWGRPLQLIDCQNLFCETDKYARIAHPEIIGFSGRTRIKQTFRMTGPISQPVFPEKWRLVQPPELTWA
jgi:hypothetical protein